MYRRTIGGLVQTSGLVHHQASPGEVATRGPGESGPACHGKTRLRRTRLVRLFCLEIACPIRGMSLTPRLAVPGTSAIPISPPYFRGRFANGPMWIEELANALGLQIAPSLDGGTNFAFGGALTGADLDHIFQQDVGVTILSLRSQVAAYRATLLDPTLTDPTRMKQAPVDALYVVWGGANDLREAVRQGTQGAAPAQIASDTVGNLVDIIRTLQSSGAIYFLVPNLPDLGLTPQHVARGQATMQLATDLSNAFNSTLESALQQLESSLPVQIARLDIATHFRELIATPLRFGVSNVTEACISGDPFDPGTVCAQPEHYIFWDAIGHPTALPMP